MQGSCNQPADAVNPRSPTTDPQPRSWRGRRSEICRPPTRASATSPARRAPPPSRVDPDYGRSAAHCRSSRRAVAAGRPACRSRRDREVLDKTGRSRRKLSERQFEGLAAARRARAQHQIDGFDGAGLDARRSTAPPRGRVCSAAAHDPRHRLSSSISRGAAGAACASAVLLLSAVFRIRVAAGT